MPALGFLFGPTEGERRAEQQRQDAEDRLMAVHALERTDLGHHCDAEAERAIVFITRIRDLGATQAARADRNLTATIIIGVLILAKGSASIGEIARALLAGLGLMH